MQTILRIAGLDVPSQSPLFLAILAFHALAALIAVVAGVVAMLSPKRAGRHPRSGTIYYWSLAVVFASAAAMAAMRWTEDDVLFILGAIAYGAATLGRAARRGRWHGWARVHIPAMGFSYIVMLTAFYVDNGHSLPVWRSLPRLAYWLVPTVVGIPLIARALLRYGRSQEAA